MLILIRFAVTDAVLKEMKHTGLLIAKYFSAVSMKTSTNSVPNVI